MYKTEKIGLSFLFSNLSLSIKFICSNRFKHLLYLEY